MNSVADVWQVVLERLRAGGLAETAISTWFDEVEAVAIRDMTFYLCCPNDFKRGTIESLFLPNLKAALKEIFSADFDVKLLSAAERDALGQEKPKKPTSLLESGEFTFDTFVVGSNNNLAHAAALAVAESPGEIYNPLFIYGGVGLGKTHLMHAIGNRILEDNINTNVLYVTSEKFTNQLINAIKDNKNEIFRNKYRNVDVLLVDDVQFIAGKERIQEEFFHTFNTLYEDRKQIILSSDKPPRDIPFLEDRLKSRFEWGLLADISCPDYETRLAILRKKAQDENILIDDFILSNIATKIDSNIRELEGVFNKIVARASLIHSPISIEFAENIINEFKAESEKVISCDFIKETVAKYFSIDPNDLSGNKRSAEIAFPRQIAMYLCREVANMSFPKIGADFGNRDHSTVMHAYKKIQKEVKEKNNTKLIVESVKNIITDTKQ